MKDAGSNGNKTYGGIMPVTYLLAPFVLAPVPEIRITQQEYLDAKRCHKQVYEAFEIELAFDFVVTNYIEIEKYVAENLVLNMAGQIRTVDAYRLQNWGFIRTLNNWLGSISFWRDLMRKRLIDICGRGSELQDFKKLLHEVQNDEFVTAFLFHLRNYSQHGGFPLTGASTGGSWNEGRTELTYSANYTLSYDEIRPYFEQGGQDSKSRKEFSKKIEAYSEGKPFDLKPIIRQSIGLFGHFMDKVRSSMEQQVHANELFVEDLIKRYTSAHPDVSILGLSAMWVADKEIVKHEADVVPVRDEFVVRAREMRKKNNGKTLASMGKRLISNR
jgi:hypothetical protein